MHRTLFSLLIGLLILSLGVGTIGQTTDEAAPNPDDLWGQFQLIVDRNIFSRQRSRPRPKKQSSEPKRPRYVATPESLVVLKGIVKENNRFVAFFEDTQSGTSLHIHVGQAVARGQVAALTLDHVVFTHEGKTRIVTIGQNLEGVYGSSTIGFNDVMEWSSSSTSSSPSTPSTPAATTPSAEQSDVLKKLMERRRQQLGD